MPDFASFLFGRKSSKAMAETPGARPSSNAPPSPSSRASKPPASTSSGSPPEHTLPSSSSHHPPAAPSAPPPAQGAAPKPNSSGSPTSVASTSAPPSRSRDPSRSPNLGGVSPAMKNVEPTEGSSLSGFAGTANGLRTGGSTLATGGTLAQRRGSNVSDGGLAGVGNGYSAAQSSIGGAPVPMNRGSSLGAALGDGYPATSNKPVFPLLPASQPSATQTHQSAKQVKSILSLPPALLLNLARSSSLGEQQEIAKAADATSYLSAMALPPPSPTVLVSDLAGANTTLPLPSVTTIGDHPALPLLLGQAFAPPTPGIAAPFGPVDTGKAFEPSFASVEDWSLQVAREKVQAEKTKIASSTAAAPSSSTRPQMTSSKSFTDVEINEVAAQMKEWALKSQDENIQSQVIASKQAAVIIASQVAARSHVTQLATSVVSENKAREGGIGPSPSQVELANTILRAGQAGGQAFESAVNRVDLGAYAESYKTQLDAISGGYYAQLHREAMARLIAESGPEPMPQSRSPALPPSSTPDQATAMHVQAAAAAAVAATVMAANEMASTGWKSLSSMGVDEQKLAHLVPKKQRGLAALEVTPETLAVAGGSSPIPIAGATATPPIEDVPMARSSSSSKSRPGATPMVPSAGTNADAEVQALLESSPTATPAKRDYLLAAAHALYSKDPSNQTLLPLLHTIEANHPDHLPTLLLMSCVYYSRGELDSSLFYNSKLLEHDPNYVEAMSNIGTTLRAMGKWRDAEGWWWKAIKLRPTYWDATENLLGVLCNPAPAHKSVPTAQGDLPPAAPRYSEALALCDYVEAQVYGASTIAPIPRPRDLPASVPSNHVHRLQNLFYAKGNLRVATGDVVTGVSEYAKAVECALALPTWAKSDAVRYPLDGVSVRDLIVVTTIIGKVMSAYAQSGGVPTLFTAETIASLGVADVNGALAFDNLFQIVRAGGDNFAARLLAMGGGRLPMVLLRPEDVNRLPAMIFPATRGRLPSMAEASGRTNQDHIAAHNQASHLTNQTTSTMLLTIAKLFQDSLASPGSPLTLEGFPISQSLLLPLYYVALSLHPSPSTCNNLGILLSTLNTQTLVAEHPNAQPVVLTGQSLALLYYKAGLVLDPKHPHLYTNFGSLLKDMGQLHQAVLMYKQAVEFNPTFDVALANLANAIKDTGSVQDSIQYYRRAVELNPDFPEAICGLVNALGGVCDWVGRGGAGECDWVVDNQGNMTTPARVGGRLERSGYLGRISTLIGKQLREGLAYGSGIVRQSGTLEQWLAVVSMSIYGLTPADIGPAADPWIFRLRFLLSDFDRQAVGVNEGGFVIRLTERLMKRIQRRWYLTVYGAALVGTADTQRIIVDPSSATNYRRPFLPPALPIVTVPTILPFHLFTYPVSPRETRLISHRTGLRISHSTLSQPWLPPHVYPPPPPPIGGKINIGYVSSDLGNHPLSHLMQSVFGFHDQTKFNTFVYATSPNDKSPYRLKIEEESQNFADVSALSTQAIVDRIIHDGIHILINLSGYTKGARNEVFAARPCPVQMSYMGFAGTLSAGWYPIVCPPSLSAGNVWRHRQGYTLPGNPVPSEGDLPTDFEGDPDPEGPSEDFVYTEKLIYMPHSYFVTDHKQAWFEDSTPVPAGEVAIANDGKAETVWAIEEDKRWKMRREMFPELNDNTVILANWNQLYKIDPFVFRIWLKILQRTPNSILWLLRFPAPGEANLKATALKWAGPEVASRIIFTDVTNKNDHIKRGRIVDLFLDTTECNAHTTCCDILAVGTPVLTWPRTFHKMASRVAASIVLATGFGESLIVDSEEAYETRALALCASLSYDYFPARKGADPGAIDARPQRRGRGELAMLRKNLFLTRAESPLFDTKRWVHNVEKGYVEAWKRWVDGTEMEDAAEWGNGEERLTGNIWIHDDVDGVNFPSREKYFKP
ncbi:polypeptide N-acetylglucosaminyltransferase, glycosyltransferase family 41 protein [Pseudohyphozyma bogoriensis]|nr:polypeptide N-acetylglucosaminyltransferase, glycosyltransferase family 41 protein [Pseudohyphozyma bogoriensis]